MPVVTNSTELRTAIQNATSATVIDLATSGSPYSVDTLAKFPCATPLVPQSGYTIQTEDFANTGIKAVLSNTRIYQQNIDGPYAPGTVKEVVLNYTSGTNAIFRATSGTYTFDAIDITGTHSGWAGNGNVYMSMTVSNGNTPIASRLLFQNSTVSVTGQGGYNAAANTGNASAFLQSWNNSGIDTGSGVARAVILENVLFDEAGFKTSFHFANMLPGGAAATPANFGTYTIENSLFYRTSNQNARDRGNRLESVVADVFSNAFANGSYLDLAGDISSITIGGFNIFDTIYGGKGINFTKTSSSGAVLSSTSISSIAGNMFNGYGLAFTYAAAGANDVFTVNGTNFITIGGDLGPTINAQFDKFLTGGSGNNSITSNGTDDWIYGGAGSDTISAGAGNDWIIGGTGADAITPGTGADSILYYGTDEGSDTITGFVSGTDKLLFRAGGGGAATAFSPTTIFQTTAPTTAGPTLSYVGGVLRYDADGNGGGAAVTIATFVGSPAIAASDIQLF